MLASGCGDDGAPDPEPSPSTTSAPSAPTVEPSAPTAPGAPSSSVPPNTGPVLRLTNSSLRVPKGYELVSNNPDGLVASAYNSELISGIGLSDGPDTADGTLTLREQARIASSGYLRTPKFQRITTLAGQEGFYLAGPIDRVSRIDLVGLVYEEEDSYITVDIQVPIQMPKKERQTIVDATLASFRLR